MNENKAKYIIAGLCVINLSSCVIYDNTSNVPAYQTYTYDNSQLYPQDYNANDLNYRYSSSQGSGTVAVPDSYHVGQFHSPVSFKDRDKTWASGQNPQGYTIEIAEGDKASQVAQKLYKAPKSDRMAQLKYENNGKAYYKGVYGSYPDAASAQKALDALPPEIKQGAGVKNWGSVQQNLE